MASEGGEGGGVEGIFPFSCTLELLFFFQLLQLLPNSSGCNRSTLERVAEVACEYEQVHALFNWNSSD